MAKTTGVYSIKTNGAVTCRNQTIGHLDLETGKLSLDINVPPAGMTSIKAQIYDLMQERRNAPETPRGKPLIEVFSPPPMEELKSAAQPTHDQETSLLGPLSREEYASYQPPPPPAQDPRLGDKTPAYMQWLGENFPEEYRKRYKGRKTHLTTGINPHLARDIPEIAMDKPQERWGPGE